MNPGGTVRWEYACFASSVAVGPEGTVYVCSTRNAPKNLSALSSGGTLLWSTPTTNSQEFELAIGADGIVYYVADESVLYAVYPGGTPKWSFQAAGRIISAPVIGPDGTLYLVAQDSGSGTDTLVAVHPDGTAKWAAGLPARLAEGCGLAVGADGTVYVPLAYSSYYQGRLSAVGPDGSLKWTFSVSEQAGYCSPVIDSDGTILFGFGGSLYVIGPTGTEKWHGSPVSGEPTSSCVSTPAIGADGTIYYSTRHDSGNYSGWVVAVSRNGLVRWKVDFGCSLFYSKPALGTDGTLYIGCADGCLYALQTSSPGLADSPWPMHRRDPGHTGSAVP